MEDTERIARLATLNDKDRHILSLYALGWRYVRIATQVHMVEGTIRMRMSGIRDTLGFEYESRTALALFYVDHELPKNVEMWRQWIERAKSLYQTICAARTVPPHAVKLIDLLADPEHADKSNRELGELLVAGTDAKPLNERTVQSYITAIGNVLPGDTNRIRVATIGRLRVCETPEVPERPQVIAEMLETLTKDEWRIASLVALGWSHQKIATTLLRSAFTISELVQSCKSKLGLLGHSNAALAVFYVRHMLPIDVYTGHQVPGQKLLAWQSRAKDIRESLRLAGVLDGQAPQVVMYLVRPENIECEHADVAAEFGLQPSTVNTMIGRITGVMEYGCRAKLAVVATLAPFDEEER